VERAFAAAAPAPFAVARSHPLPQSITPSESIAGRELLLVPFCADAHWSLFAIRGVQRLCDRALDNAAVLENGDGVFHLDNLGMHVASGYGRSVAPALLALMVHTVLPLNESVADRCVPRCAVRDTLDHVISPLVSPQARSARSAVREAQGA